MRRKKARLPAARAPCARSQPASGGRYVNKWPAACQDEQSASVQAFRSCQPKRIASGISGYFAVMVQPSAVVRRRAERRSNGFPRPFARPGLIDRCAVGWPAMRGPLPTSRPQPAPHPFLPTISIGRHGRHELRVPRSGFDAVRAANVVVVTSCQGGCAPAAATGSSTPIVTRCSARPILQPPQFANCAASASWCRSTID